jgi:hypothetical protein
MERSRPLNQDRWSRARLSRTKTPCNCPVKTLAHSSSLSRASVFSTRASESGDRHCTGATVSPFASERVHRKVSAPPSSGITVVPRSSARRAARRRLAQPLSTLGPRPCEVGSTCQRPECVDNGWRKERRGKSSP